jgi:hypothetical protein
MKIKESISSSNKVGRDVFTFESLRRLLGVALVPGLIHQHKQHE